MKRARAQQDPSSSDSPLPVHPQALFLPGIPQAFCGELPTLSISVLR